MSGINGINNTNNYATKASSHLAQMRMANNTAIVPQNMVKVAVRCPHGFPGGGCPICMGKAGGGGGADKKLTGMSWNEAYSVFNKLKLIKLLAQQDQKNLEVNQQRNLLVEKLEKAGLLQRLVAINNVVQTHIANFKNVLGQAKQVVTATTLKVVNSFVNILKDSVTKLLGVVNKLTAVMGEKIKVIRDNVQKNIKNIMEKMLQIEGLNRLMMVFNDKRHLFQEFLLKKVESLKEKILRFTDMIRLLTKDKNNQGKKQKGKKKKDENNKK